MISTLLIATQNPHKIEEIQEIFSAIPNAPKLMALTDLADVPPEPEENEPTFEGNAFLKASYYAQRVGMHCLADDSGLEVDALNGEPGVRSARYAGVDGTRDERDAANNQLLLKNLNDVSDDRRSARFVCAMCIVCPDRPDEALASARGTFEGRIARAPKGDNGFGYDPLLIPADPTVGGRHAAELTSDEKHARSHRGNATRMIAEQLAGVAPCGARH